MRGGIGRRGRVEAGAGSWDDGKGKPGGRKYGPLIPPILSRRERAPQVTALRCARPSSAWSLSRLPHVGPPEPPTPRSRASGRQRPRYFHAWGHRSRAPRTLQHELGLGAVASHSVKRAGRGTREMTQGH